MAENADIVTLPVAYTGQPENGCLVRLNSACITSEVFGDTACDCKWQLDESFRIIAEADQGLIIYLPHHEGRGIGLFNKIETMNLMERKRITSAAAFQELHFDPDVRRYDCTVPIFEWFGISEITLITNNPRKVLSQIDAGIKVSKRRAIVCDDPALSEYLSAKREQLGHLIDTVESGE